MLSHDCCALDTLYTGRDALARVGIAVLKGCIVGYMLNRILGNGDNNTELSAYDEGTIKFMALAAAPARSWRKVDPNTS